MRIARLLIYEGTKEALDLHFSRGGIYLKPGETRVGDYDVSLAGVTIHEDAPREIGGRVELEPGELAAIRTVK